VKTIRGNFDNAYCVSVVLIDYVFMSL